jgi:hypothetical protein
MTTKFKKGNDPRRNKNGRPKGTPNKTSDELRAAFQSFLETNLDGLQSDFDKLEPKERLYFIERVARLILPPPMHPIDQMSDIQFQELLLSIRNNKFMLQ